MNQGIYNIIVIFSDPNFLAVNLFKSLLNENHRVYIVTSSRSDWYKKIADVKNSQNYKIINLREYYKLTNFSHAIFFGGFLRKNKLISEFKKFILNKNLGKALSLAVLPAEASPFKNKNNISISKNAGIIYVGDLLGEGIDLNSDLLLPTLINEIIQKKSLTLGIGELLFPLDVSDLSHFIIKKINSSEFYGKETEILGKPLPSNQFWKLNIKIFPNIKVAYNTKIKARVLQKRKRIITLDSEPATLLHNTYTDIVKVKNSLPSKTAAKKIPQALNMKRKIRTKILRVAFLTTLLTAFLPVLTTLFSAPLLYLSYRQLISENSLSSQKTANIAKTMFLIGKAESAPLTRIPFVGGMYKEFYYISYIGEQFSDVLANSAPILSASKTLTDNIFTNNIHDVKEVSVQIKSGLDYLFRTAALVNISTNEFAKNNVITAKKIAQTLDLEKTESLFREGGYIASSLPTLLGSDQNRDYLILFQNNMELRPTGGFIGSYGIASMGGGRLNGLSINDVYSADGQLKGHVEPPGPIKSYLKEANWWFRDSNWDPDFPKSASRAEWFLEKEMGQKVDGVIAIDLLPIKEILGLTGPIFLPDYNLTITPENLYEKTQEEAENNFFPGSRKKASFLTALSRVLLDKIAEMNSSEKIHLLALLYRALESRSIQLYLHNSVAQNSINQLGWGGGFTSHSCGEECYSDFFGGVEANVGVNKANYFVKRLISIKATIDSKKITRSGTISLQNTSDPKLAAAGQYKVYVRILIPEDAKVLSVKKIDGSGEKQLTYDLVQIEDRQELGTYVEIGSAQKNSIEFIWESLLPDGKPIKNYSLFIRKQAGTQADRINVEVKAPTYKLMGPWYTSLTKEGVYTYNSILGKDFIANFSLK